MLRDLKSLSSREFDVVVIGGGITGAFAAWDGALRGLKVALIEKGDFGQATSGNSLKTIHGGLRYLQDGDLAQVRSMMRERSTFRLMAPHLLHPMPFLLPTNRRFPESRAVMAAAFAINRVVGFDIQAGLSPSHRFPPSKVLSRSAGLQKLPDIPHHAVTGVALWFDWQVRDTERLLLAVLQAAESNGAVVANYLEAIGSLQHPTGSGTLEVVDHLTGQSLDVRGKVFLNCTGAWSQQVLGAFGIDPPNGVPEQSVALNLVVTRSFGSHAFGIRFRPGDRDPHTAVGLSGQTFFFVPWQGHTMIGTMHLPNQGQAHDLPARDEDIHAFLSILNRAYPNSRLTKDDISLVHAGYLPSISSKNQRAGVRLFRKGFVIEHHKEGAFTGVITVVGVKYSTARLVAEQAVDLACHHLERPDLHCRTHQSHVHGGKMDSPQTGLQELLQETPDHLSEQSVTRLFNTYGTEARQLIETWIASPELAQPIANGEAITRGELLHAVRNEMAHSLADVIRRRTTLGQAGFPNNQVVEGVADLLAEELGWDKSRRAEEIRHLASLYPAGTIPASLARAE